MVEERQWGAHIKTKAHRVQAQKKSGSWSRRRKDEEKQREGTRRGESADASADAVEVADDANIQSS